jgi:sugar phosphate isomerase/epimerase
MRWRFAAATGCCVNLSVLTALDACHGAGLTAVELGTPPRHFDPWRHDEVTGLGERLRSLGIEPISIHAPFGGLLDLSDPNPHHRHAAIGAILTAAAALREIGGSRIVVHVTDVVRDGQNVEERLARCTDALGVLARACSHMGVKLLVETPLPHLIGGHPDEFARVVGQLDRSVGVCFDTGHVALGHHWDRFIELAGDRLVHVHVNDNRGRFDDHLPPGEGTIDWCHIRETLEQVGFDGWIVLELSCPAGPLSEYLRNAMERTQALFPSVPA